MDSTTTLSDHDFALLKARDRKIFEKIYNRDKDRIFTFLMAKSFGRKEIADELFAEVSLAFYESLPKLKTADNITGFWFRIAANKFNDYLRKHYRKQKTTAAFNDVIEDNCHDKGALPDEEAIHNEKQRYVALAIEEIHPHYKEILTLKYYDGKSQKEIAELLKLNERAVEALLFRARKSMSEAINRLYIL